MLTGEPVETRHCHRCRGGRETYIYWQGMYEFDVDRARALTSDGRDPVELEDDSVRDSVEMSKIDAEHIAHVDPSYPGIIAHVVHRTEAGELIRGHLLIDGNHRAARCLRDGRPFLAYLLTEEESHAILLCSPDMPDRAAAATHPS